MIGVCYKYYACSLNMPFPPICNPVRVGSFPYFNVPPTLHSMFSVGVTGIAYAEAEGLMVKGEGSDYGSAGTLAEGLMVEKWCSGSAEL